MCASLIPRFPFLVLLTSVLLIPARVRCQEAEGTAKERAPVLMRILCKQPVAGATDLRIVQEGKVRHELQVSPSLITDPLGVGRGDLLLARVAGDPENPTFDPVLKITIPPAGKRFVLALFAPLAPAPGKTYEHRLVRTDGLRFDASDLYLFNLTAVPIGGSLGTENFAIKPNESAVVRPKPSESGARVYQSRFYFQQDGEVRLFNDTRWPLAKSARVYIFFVPDPQRRSIGYQTFREYAPFP